MTIISCPRCQDEVTVPPQATIGVLVRCPLCGEQYSMTEALAETPPALIVVGKDPLVAHVRIEPTGTAASESVRARGIEGRSSVRRPISPRRRPRGVDRRNPFYEVFKIVAGGVVGLTLGQLVLWWMPGNWGLSQRDPAGIGRRFGRFAPFLVPGAVRGFVADYAGTPSDPESETGGAERRSQDRSDGAGPSESSGRGDGPLGSSVEPDSRSASVPGASESATDPAPSRSADSNGGRVREGGKTGGKSTPSVQSDARTAPAEGSGPRSGSDANMSPGTGEATLPRASGDRSPASVGVADAPRVPADEAGALLSSVQLLWEQSPTAERPTEIAEPLVELARDITFIDTTDPDAAGVGESVRSWLVQIAPSPSEAAALAAAVGARSHDASSDRPLAGNVVSGRVASIEATGAFFETRLRGAGNQQAVVLSAVDPSGTYAVGDEVLILGIVVRDPERQLVGYSGPVKRATFGGLAVRLAAE
ncbi:MAG: hypothetical protein FJ297_15855 [Planctomycetes bacterium]|nr:hypothetical protein [Planctomycetota bacterium]